MAVRATHFEYDADWLKSSANYMYLDPDLQLYAGRQYPTGAKMCSVFSLTPPRPLGSPADDAQRKNIG